jgi:hypothetical protein
MTVRADKDRVAVAERVNLSILIDAPEGVDLEPPEVGESLGAFRVQRSNVQPSIPTEHGRQWRQEYALESYSSGEQQIPSLTTRFTDRQAGGEPAEGEITAPPLPIQVASSLEGDLDPTQFADIKGAVDLPAPSRWAWLAWIGAALGAVLLAGLAVILWRRRRRRTVVAPLIPAHEWALEQLRLLQAARLVERGELKEFYFRLTGIVRQYIERRFGIMAAEQTTREFLEATKGHPALGVSYRALLGEFLAAGDLVKFARFQPDGGQVEDAFATARGFVQQTAEPPSPAEQEVAA